MAMAAGAIRISMADMTETIMAHVVRRLGAARSQVVASDLAGTVAAHTGAAVSGAAFVVQAMPPPLRTLRTAGGLVGTAFAPEAKQAILLDAV